MTDRTTQRRPARKSAAPRSGSSRRATAAAPAWQRILVPLDGSRASSAALRAALGLARNFAATVVAYHALPPLPVPSFDAAPAGFPTPAQQRLEARQLGRRHIEKAARLAASAAVRFESLIEPRVEVASAVATAARRRRCDLIVLGSHGRGRLGRLLMGSVATELLSIAPVPVLVLPAQAMHRRLARQSGRRTAT